MEGDDACGWGSRWMVRLACNGPSASLLVESVAGLASTSAAWLISSADCVVVVVAAGSVRIAGRKVGSINALTSSSSSPITGSANVSESGDSGFPSPTAVSSPSSAWASLPEAWTLSPKRAGRLLELDPRGLAGSAALDGSILPLSSWMQRR